MEKQTKIIIGLVAGVAVVGTAIYLYNENKKAEKTALGLVKDTLDIAKKQSDDIPETKPTTETEMKQAFEKAKSSGVATTMGEFLKKIADKEAVKKTEPTQSEPQVSEKEDVIKLVPNKTPLSDGAWKFFVQRINKLDKTVGKSSRLSKIVNGKDNEISAERAKNRFKTYVTLNEFNSMIKFFDLYAAKRKESDVLKALGKQRASYVDSGFKKMRMA